MLRALTVSLSWAPRKRMMQCKRVLCCDPLGSNCEVRPTHNSLGGGANAKHVSSWVRRHRQEHLANKAVVEKDRADPLTCVPRRWHDPDEVAQSRTGARPARLLRRFTPEALFKAIHYSQDIRDQSTFVDTLRKAEQYMEERRGPTPAGLRVDDVDHPSDRTNLRSFMRLGSVASLIQRREVEAMIEAGALRSCHLYADGSPVTGLEIQAMLVDFGYHDGTFERTILPAVLLGYGLTTALDKVLALLWALWLIVGPSMVTLQVILDSVISFTTDQGTESSMLDVPDILPAFMQWIAGAAISTLGPHINFDRKLFRRALRIPGFGHVCAGLVHFCCKWSPNYPRYLGHMRALVSMMRNQTHREHLARVYKHKPYAKLLEQTWTSHFLKWRYAALHDVAEDLLVLRESFEHDLSEHVFNDFQDRELFQACMSAKDDTQFWR